MKSFAISLICVLFGMHSMAQEFNAETFNADILKLYNVATHSFKELKNGEAFESKGGQNHYKSTLELNGAKTVYLSEDEEHSYTYVAQYTFKNERNPQEKMEEFVKMIADATAQYGLERGKGTDIKYIGYQKHTIEFPSDNIDDMGKYPSFIVGLTGDGNPMSFEIQISEILWK